MKKRFLSIFLIVMLFISCIPFQGVAAVGTSKYELAGKTVQEGDIFTMDVAIAENPGIISLRFKVVYDEAVLELQSVANSGVLNGFTTPSPTISSPYTLRWADSLATTDNTSNGAVVTLTFKALQTTSATSVTIEHGEARNSLGTKVTFENAQANVKVNAIPIPATGVTLNKNTLTLIENTNETLIATVSPTNTTDTVVWDSSKDEVATVDTNGNVIAVAPGTATITATAGNFSDECVVTVKCSHSVKVFHAEKTNATCQEQNYSAYYLCTCGQYLASDGTTEIDGIPYTGNGNHSYGSDWDKQSSTEAKHYHKCSVCGGLDVGENHTVGTAANCLDKTICGECDKAYGSINPDNHKTPTTFKYVKIDENNHKKLYDCCDALAVASESHIYDNASDMVCNGCGYDRTHYCGNGVLHTGFVANCATMTNGEKDYYICSCGKKYYDATCLSPVLDETDLVIAWKHTLTHHNPDLASCWENGTVEYWRCSKCSKNFGTSNEQDTNALATIVDPATGNHNFGSTWVDGNDGYHYHICTTTGCTAKDTANRQAHSGGTATCQEKATCTACGAKHGNKGGHTWSDTYELSNADANKHYHVCIIVGCSEKDEGEDHTGGTANCQSAKICSECTKEYGSIDENVHVGTASVYVPKNNETHDVKYSGCGHLAANNESCVFDNASDIICDLCGYDRTHHCGNPTYKAEESADCTTQTNGKVAHYECSCGLKYEDITCLVPITDITVPWSHSLIHHDADPASCWENGTVEYWNCSKCNKNFGTSNVQDSAPLSTIIDLATGNHNFGSTWVDGEDGYHYHLCTTTGCTAKDTANRQEHSGGTATCQEKATCTVCGAKHGEKGGHTWSDTYELANADANKHYHVCIIAGCAEKDEGEDHTGGTATCEEAKTCSVCSKRYGEKDMNNHTGTATNIIPNNDGTHDVKYTCCGIIANDNMTCSGGTATCTSEAICEHCNTAYGNKDVTNHTSDEFTFADNGDGTHTKKNKCCNAIVGEPEEHDYGDDNICDSCNYDITHYCGNGTLVKGKAATCTEPGKKDNYECSCGKIYLDATCKTLVTSEDELVIKATGVHTDADKNNKCDECGAIIDKTVTSPQTGDNSNITLWIALAFISASALVGLTLYSKKRRT